MSPTRGCSNQDKQTDKTDVNPTEANETKADETGANSVSMMLSGTSPATILAMFLSMFL